VGGVEDWQLATDPASEDCSIYRSDSMVGF